MTQIERTIKILEIIKKYDPESGIAAEHDEIYCGNPEKIPTEAKAELEELGCYESEYDSMRILV